MPFDEMAYERDVLRPLRRHSGAPPPGDFHRRYAIEPGMTSTEIAARISEVRAVWLRLAAAPDHTGRVCRSLLEADAELQQRAGEMMVDPHWWAAHEQVRRGTALATEPADTSAAEALGVVTVDPVNASGPPLTDEVLVSLYRPGRDRLGRAMGTPDDLLLTTDGGCVRITWRAVRGARYLLSRVAEGDEEETSLVPVSEGLAIDTAPPAGRALRYCLVSVVDGVASQPAVAETVVRPPSENAPGRAEAIEDLTVERLRGVQDRQLVSISWESRPGSQVSVYRFPRWPSYVVGQRLTRAEVSAAGGQPVEGERTLAGRRMVLVAEVPVGYQTFAAFVGGAGELVCGRPVGASAADKVQELRLHEDGQRLLWWRWPLNVNLAQVTWHADERPRSVQVARSSFDRQYGFPLPWSGAGTVEVRTVTRDLTSDMLGDPVTLEVPAAPVVAAYSLHGPCRLQRVLGRFPVRARVWAEAEIRGMSVRVLVTAGDRIPLRPQDGRVVFETGTFDLPAGESRTFTFDIPAELRRHRPFWVQCVVHAAQRLTISPLDMHVR